MSTIQPTQSLARSPARSRLTLLVMCLATFMIQVDVTIVTVALPAIQTGLDLDTDARLRVMTAYALSLAAFIPVASAVGDRFGHKPVFLTGVALFVIGSAACAASATGLALVTARTVQGAGGAAMLALALSIVTNTFPSEVRARMIGIWAAVGGTGFGVGPVVGGLILSVTRWPAVFWVNVPVGLLALGGAWAALPRSPGGVHPLDRRGALLCATGLLCLTYGLIGSSTRSWASPVVAGPLMLGVLLLVGFVIWERRAAHPMAPPALLHVPGFVPASSIYLIVYVAFGGILYFATLLYQDIAGWSALRTGLSWLFMNVPFLLLAQFGGPLQRLLPARTLIVTGCLAATCGALLLAAADATTPLVLTAAGFTLCGAGFGALMPVLAHVAMSQVPPRLSGVASGLFNTGRQVGTSIGLAVLGYVGATATLSAWHARIAQLSHPLSPQVSAQTQHVVSGQEAVIGHTLGPAYRQAAAASFEHGYHWAVAVGAAIFATGALIGARTFPRRGPRRRDPTRRGPRDPGRGMTKGEQ